MTIPQPSLILPFGPTGILDPRLTIARNSIGSRFDRTNTLVQVPAHTARFEHEIATSKRLGLLIEGNLQQRILQSEALDNASWTKTNSSIVANTATGPDGNTTMDRVVENTSNASHSVDQSVALSAGAAFTVSMYATPNQRTACAISILGAANGGRVHFDLTGAGAVVNEAVGTGSVVGSGIILVKPNLYYCWACVLIGGSDTTANIRLLMKNGTSTGAITYTGDGSSSLYFGFVNGSQGGTAGLQPSQYIATTTAAVSSALEQISMPTAPWFRADEGTFVVHFRVPRLAVNNLAAVVFSVDDGTSNERYHLSFQNTLSGIVVDGGAVQAAMATTLAAANTDTKVAFAYKANDFAVVSDGAAAVTDTAGTLPSPTTLRLGLATDNTSGLFSTINRLAYYPARISNAEMQQLTA